MPEDPAMDIPKFAPNGSKYRHVGGSSATEDLEIVEIPKPAAWESRISKRKRGSQIAPLEVIEIEEDDDPDGAVIIDSMPSKNKQPMLPYKSWRKQAEGRFTRRSSPSLNKTPVLPGKNSQKQAKGGFINQSLPSTNYQFAMQNLTSWQNQAMGGFIDQSLPSTNYQFAMQNITSWQNQAMVGFPYAFAGPSTSYGSAGGVTLDSSNVYEAGPSLMKFSNELQYPNGYGDFGVHFHDDIYDNYDESNDMFLENGYGSAGGVTLDSSNVYEAGPSLMKFSNEPQHPNGYGYFGVHFHDDIYENYDEYNDMFLENDYGSNFYKFDNFDLPSGVEITAPSFQKPADNQPCKKSQMLELEDPIDVKYKAFRQFDTIQGHSDHYYNNPGQIKKNHPIPHSFRASTFSHQPSNDWAKRIQNDWKILEKDLPETIFVRVYEDRMDILRAVIIGPAGTPYHDGLFFFDIHFPPSYPQTPPLVHYHSGGLRLNPNLYECGKVCLSLLNTWGGSGCEKWNPKESTMLQVLVSIQALVLNAKPYFNEPGFARSVNTPQGEDASLRYNEKTFVLSCKTMLYSLRKPPKHFEEFVAGHFRKYGRPILLACKAYIGGAQVGCLADDGIQDVDEGEKSSSSRFKSLLKIVFQHLHSAFTAIGADCDVFLFQTVEDGKKQVTQTISRPWESDAWAE